MPWNIRLLVLLAVGWVAADGGSSPRAFAATFTVTKTADTADGACNADCSLREAIIAANEADPFDSQFIEVPPGTYALTRVGPDEDASIVGDLDILSYLFLNGSGADTTIIDATALVGDRVLDVIGTLFAEDITITGGDTSGSGGGIYAREGLVSLVRSSVRGNRSTAGTGAGVHVDGFLFLNETTVSGNHCEDLCTGGGGVAMTDPEGIDGYAAFSNSTISGNSAPPMSGGGILIAAQSLLQSVSVFGNSGGGVRNETPPIDEILVKNSIISEAPACTGPGGWDSAGYNLSSDATCPFTSVGDLLDTDPMFAPLGNNGGTTETLALVVGSPAIDSGSCINTGDFPLEDDQRGISRPQGPGCDRGALEMMCIELSPPVWSVPAGDSDCDGFPDIVTAGVRGREDFMGTDAADRCADTTTPNDEQGPSQGEPLSPWPPDINDTRRADISDVVLFGASFNKSFGQAGYDARMDLTAGPGAGAVNISDVVVLGPFFNKLCTP